MLHYTAPTAKYFLSLTCEFNHSVQFKVKFICEQCSRFTALVTKPWVSCLSAVTAFAATVHAARFFGQKILFAVNWTPLGSLHLRLIWGFPAPGPKWGQCWCCDRKLLTWSRCKDKRPPPTQLQTVDDCSNCRHIQEHCGDKEFLISLVLKGKCNSQNNTPKTSVFKEHIKLHSRRQTRYFSYSNISTCCQVNPCPLVVK